MPSLRERREDVPLLIRHFVNIFAQRMKKQIEVIPPEVIDTLARHTWPGNIRELENYIERAVILTQGPVLRAPIHELLQSDDEPDTEPITLQDAERAHIAKILRECNGVIGTAAVRLGLPRSTLFYKMRRLGISVARAATANCTLP
jgi:formate hydrogenlyase transcriptional activator